MNSEIISKQCYNPTAATEDMISIESLDLHLFNQAYCCYNCSKVTVNDVQ